METCFTPYCLNPPIVEKVIDAPFSMTSTATNSRRVVRICAECAEQDRRLMLIGDICKASPLG